MYTLYETKIKEMLHILHTRHICVYYLYFIHYQSKYVLKLFLQLIIISSLLTIFSCCYNYSRLLLACFFRNYLQRSMLQMICLHREYATYTKHITPIIDRNLKVFKSNLMDVALTCVSK